MGWLESFGLGIILFGLSCLIWLTLFDWWVLFGFVATALFCLVGIVCSGCHGLFSLALFGLFGTTRFG